jgi:hypothetical protein
MTGHTYVVYSTAVIPVSSSHSMTGHSYVVYCCLTCQFARGNVEHERCEENVMIVDSEERPFGTATRKFYFVCQNTPEHTNSTTLPIVTWKYKSQYSLSPDRSNGVYVYVPLPLAPAPTVMRIWPKAPTKYA